MTDFKELREALDAGPTDGPWVAAGPSFGAHLPVFCDEVVLDRDDEDDCETVCQAPPERAAEATVDMRYIAAANPSTIRSLLAELDEVRRDAEAKQARIDALMLEHCPDEMTTAQLKEWGRCQVAAPSNPAIDAAMKEQQ